MASHSGSYGTFNDRDDGNDGVEDEVVITPARSRHIQWNNSNEYNTNNTDTAIESEGAGEGNEEDEEEVISKREWIASHKRQIARNLLIYLGTATVAMCVSVIGPSLLDLQLRLHTTIDRVTWLLSAKATGALFGVITAGRTIETRYRWLQLAAALAIMSASCIGCPWPQQIYFSLPIFFCFGVARAYYWCGSILTQFALWESRKNSLSWLSGQQLCGSLGSMIGPLIVRPFLTERNNTNGSLTTLNIYGEYGGYMMGEYDYVGSEIGAYMDGGYGSKMDEYEGHIDVERDGYFTDDFGDIGGFGRNGTTQKTEVMYGYLIAGSIGLCSACIFLIGHCAMGGIYLERAAGNASNPTETPKRTCLQYIVMVILVLCNFIFGSITRNYVSFMVAYSVHHLNWTKSEGAYLASIMSIAGMISKLLSIYLVRIVKLEIQLFTGVFMCMGASLLLFFLADAYHFIPWPTTVLFVLGLTNVNSVVFGWVDAVLRMRGVVGVLWNVGGCAGEIAAPFLLGYLFRHVSYAAFADFFVAGMGGVVACWLLLHALAVCIRRQTRVAEEEERLIINADVST